MAVEWKELLHGVSALRVVRDHVARATIHKISQATPCTLQSLCGKQDIGMLAWEAPSGPLSARPLHFEATIYTRFLGSPTHPNCNA